MHLAEKEQSAFRIAVFLGGMVFLLLALRFTPLYQYLDREYLRATFAAIAAEPWAPALFVMTVCLGLSMGFPLTPFTLVGGVVFGVWPGSLYNWLGTLFGASSAFLIARYVGRSFVQRLLGTRLQRLQRMDDAIARNGFWAIFSMRLIPVIPFNLSNFAAGLTGVRFSAFFSASALSLFPLVMIGTYFANALWNSTGDYGARRELLLATALMLLVSTLPWLYHRRTLRNAEARARSHLDGAL